MLFVGGMLVLGTILWRMFDGWSWREYSVKPDLTFGLQQVKISLSPTGFREASRVLGWSPRTVLRTLAVLIVIAVICLLIALISVVL